MKREVHISSLQNGLQQKNIKPKIISNENIMKRTIENVRCCPFYGVSVSGKQE